MCMVEMAIFNIQRAVTLKVGKQDLWFISSACHLMVLNICVKFHGNMSSGFKVMERTQKIVNTHTHTHTQREKTKTIYPIALRTSYAGSITRITVHVFCMSSHGLTFV